MKLSKIIILALILLGFVLSCSINVKGLNNKHATSYPVIEAEDRTIELGGTFNPMFEVNAKDKIDGNLTDEVVVIENNVDTNIAGTYDVIYQVSNSKELTINKTIEVKVSAKQLVLNSNSKINIIGSIFIVVIFIITSLIYFKYV